MTIGLSIDGYRATIGALAAIVDSRPREFVLDITEGCEPGRLHGLSDSEIEASRVLVRLYLEECVRFGLDPFPDRDGWRP